MGRSGGAGRFGSLHTIYMYIPTQEQEQDRERLSLLYARFEYLPPDIDPLTNVFTNITPRIRSPLFDSSVFSLFSNINFTNVAYWVRLI